MKIIKDLTGQNTEVRQKFYLYGATADLPEGRLMSVGTDNGTSALLGAAQGSAVDLPVAVVGTLMQLHDVSEAGDWLFTNLSTSKDAQGEIDIRPYGVFRAELSVSDMTVSIAANSGASAAEVTLHEAAGADDEIAGCWLYNASTDELRYIEDHDGAATAVLSSNIGATAWTSVAPYTVPAIFFGGVASTGLELNSTGVNIKVETDAASACARVLATHIQSSNKQIEVLDPAKHDNKTIADAKFFVDFVILPAFRAF